MTFQKTRIWHGGLAQLSGDGEVPSDPSPGSWPQETPPDPVEQDALRVEQQASVLVPTRFFPIDSLLPSTQPAALAPGVVPSESNVDTQPSLAAARFAVQLRGQWSRLSALPRGKLLAYGALLSCATVLLAWPVDSTPSRRALATTVRPEPAPQQPTSVSSPTTPATLRTPATGLERAAVDALVAGDYVTAQARYQQLARAEPDNQAFSEAQRILTVRAQAAR